jgi:hypothetical protein
MLSAEGMVGTYALNALTSCLLRRRDGIGQTFRSVGERRRHRRHWQRG